MTDKDFAAPSSSEIEWDVQMDPGEYGLYAHEKGRHISEEIAVRRMRGVTVWAQTAFFARQRGACALGLAPEHITVTPCVTPYVKTIIEKTAEALRQGCKNFIDAPTDSELEQPSSPGSSTRRSKPRSTSTQATQSPKSKRTTKKGKKT